MLDCAPGLFRVGLARRPAQDLADTQIADRFPAKLEIR
jgi:hypothetical protein